MLPASVGGRWSSAARRRSLPGSNALITGGLDQTRGDLNHRGVRPPHDTCCPGNRRSYFIRESKLIRGWTIFSGVQCGRVRHRSGLDLVPVEEYIQPVRGLRTPSSGRRQLCALSAYGPRKCLNSIPRLNPIPRGSHPLDHSSHFLLDDRRVVSFGSESNGQPRGETLRIYSPTFYKGQRPCIVQPRASSNGVFGVGPGWVVDRIAAC